MKLIFSATYTIKNPSNDMYFAPDERSVAQQNLAVKIGRLSSM